MRLKAILERTFPATIGNAFPGHKLALYAFYLLTAATLVRSAIHTFAADGGAQSIATIPLDTFAPEAVATVIGMFAFWGLSQILIGAIYVIALWRYRAMIPLLYLLLVLEYAGRTAIVLTHDIPTTGTAPGGVINIPLVLVCGALYLLSVRGGKA